MLVTRFKWFAIILIIVVLIGYCSVQAFLSFAPVLGGLPDEESQAKILRSAHYQDGVFVNLEPTTMGLQERKNVPKRSLFTWLNQILNPPAGKVPSEPLPNLALNRHSFT